MPTIRQLKRRITSVKNTAKITNALQLVAASKMRRAQDRAAQATPYAQKLRLVLAGLSTGQGGDEAPHPLLVSRPTQNIAVLHITPDRGLCGAYNANVFRRSEELFSLLREEGKEPILYTVGRKALNYFKFRNWL